MSDSASNLLSLNEVELDDFEGECRLDWIQCLSWFIFLCTAFILMGWSIWVSQDNKLMVVVLVPFVIFFCGRSLRNTMASLRVDAWIVAYDSKRMCIRIRGPTYYYLPATDSQILSLDYGLVKWIRKIRIKIRYVGGSTRKSIQYKMYLEVALNDLDLRALRNRIKDAGCHCS